MSDHEHIKAVLVNIGREVAVTEVDNEPAALFVTLMHTFKLYVAGLKQDGREELDAVYSAWQGLKENVECEYEFEEPRGSGWYGSPKLPSLKGADDEPF